MDRRIEVKVFGNHLWKDGNRAGVQGEGNVTTLRISFDEGWDEYAKSITFFDAKGRNPVKRELGPDLLEDTADNTLVYLCKIPPEPLTEAGWCSFIIEGYIEEARQRSVETQLEVMPARDTGDAVVPGAPTPTQAEQLQLEIQKIKDDVQMAAQGAQSAELAGLYAAAAAESAQAAAVSAEAAETAVSSIGTSVEDAAASAAAASGYKTAASGSASRAQTAASQAESAERDAKGYANAAQAVADALEMYDHAAEQAAAEAENAAKRAEDAENRVLKTEQNINTDTNAAQQSAAAAETARDDARAARDASQRYSMDSEAWAGTASGFAHDASVSKASAESAKSSAESAAAKAEAAQAAAEKARDEAVAAAGNAGGGGVGNIDTTALLDKATYDPQGKNTDIFQYVDLKVSAIPTPNVSGYISTHNADNTAHADIREIANSAAAAAAAAKTYTDEKVKGLGKGDMLASVYDPAGLKKDIFHYIGEMTSDALADARAYADELLEGAQVSSGGGVLECYLDQTEFWEVNDAYQSGSRVVLWDNNELWPLVYANTDNEYRFQNVSPDGIRTAYLTEEGWSNGYDEFSSGGSAYAMARIGWVELPADAWESNGNLHSQVVDIEGVTEFSQVDLTPSVEQLAIFYEKDLTFVTENEDGVVTVYAIGQKPTNDYTIQVTITEVEV